jgi:tetratricopeptide (TPR) repeat protein
LVFALFVLAVAAAAARAAAPEPSPAERDLRVARERVDAAADPGARARARIALAIAHTRRAREIGDASQYQASLEALEQARREAPGATDADKVEAWVRLGLHEFATAESLARAWLAEHPDDPDAWGLLGDALMEQGRSDEAAAPYQRMMDLRPGPGAYLRAAYWRERAGDLSGGRELLLRALAATGARDVEDRAWILVHVASLEDRAGDSARAESTLREALAVFPDYHYALAALAERLLRSGRNEEALDTARRALAAAPHPERRLIAADALRALGRESEAREQEDAFLREALTHVERPDNENLFLVDFYLDRRPDPARALALAEREASRRRDPATLERLARARARVAGVTAASF